MNAAVAFCALASLGCSTSLDDQGFGSAGPNDCVSTEPCGEISDCEAQCQCQGGSRDACTEACAIAGTNDAAELALRVLELTNAQRSQGGCCADLCFTASPRLELNVLLGRAAQEHADDMAREGYLSHDSRSGESAFTRMTGAGFAGCALSENIARGQPSAEAVVAGWLASPLHCENVHWDKVRFLGVGYSKSEDEFAHYWVQDFGG
jgi:uncharacterized protein YkwD